MMVLEGCVAWKKDVMNYLAQLTYIYMAYTCGTSCLIQLQIYSSEWICLENKYKMMLSSGNFKGEIANGVF